MYTVYLKLCVLCLVCTLNTRRKEEGEILRPTDLRTVWTSSWNPSESIKILIHGYRQNVTTKNMPQQLKDGKSEPKSLKQIHVFPLFSA